MYLMYLKEHTLSTVKQYIGNSLDPRQHNILNRLKEYSEETPGIKNILAELGLAKDKYHNTLFI